MSVAAMIGSASAASRRYDPATDSLTRLLYRSDDSTASYTTDTFGDALTSHTNAGSWGGTLTGAGGSPAGPLCERQSYAGWLESGRRVSSSLAASTFAPLHDGSWTGRVVGIARLDAVDATRTLCRTGSNSAGNGIVANVSASGSVVLTVWNSSSTDALILQSLDNAVTEGVPFVWELRKTTDSYALLVDGVEVDADTIPSPNAGDPGTTLVIGATLSGAGNQFEGFAPEVIVTENMTADIRAYLLRRWSLDVLTKPAAIAVPTGFKWTPSFDVGIDVTTFDPDTLQPSGPALYVDQATGNNSNDGSDFANALRDITAALTAANSDPTVRQIIVKAGDYRRERGTVGMVTPAQDLAFIADSGRVRVSSAELHASLTWTQNGTYPDVWQATRSGTTLVVDASQTTADGDETQLTLQESIADVDANPGSWYTESSVVYVRTADSREPDEDVLLLMTFAGATCDIGANLEGHTWHFEGFDFWGGSNAVASSSSMSHDAATTLVFKDCTFKFSQANNGLGTNNVAEVYCIDCVAAHNLRDGFNYHHTGDAGGYTSVLEERCIGRHNGLRDANNNNNGSSMHDAGAIVRVGGSYQENRGPQVPDVGPGESHSWCIATEANDSIASSSNSGFLVQDGKMWLHSCRAFGNVSQRVNVDGELNSFAFDGDGADSGTMTDYTP